MCNTDINEGWILIRPLYLPHESEGHVDAILNSYYKGKEASNQDKYHRLKEIARTVRNMHVLHPKGDGNGRTNVYGLMNKYLIEEGFCPAILPDGPDVFGGEKTPGGLAKDMLIGMMSFIEEVKKHRPKQ